MATNPDKEDGAETTVKKSRRKKKEWTGENIDDVQKKMAPLWEKLLKNKKQKDAAVGEFTEEANGFYKAAEKATGIPVAILRGEWRFFMANKNRAEMEAELTEAEREQIIAVRDAFKGTSFESCMNHKLAKGAITT